CRLWTVDFRGLLPEREQDVRADVLVDGAASLAVVHHVRVHVEDVAAEVRGQARLEAGRPGQAEGDAAEALAAAAGGEGEVDVAQLADAEQVQVVAAAHQGELVTQGDADLC